MSKRLKTFDKFQSSLLALSLACSSLREIGSLMGRAPCCDKANVKRGPWSPDEDTSLKNYVERHGTGGNWISLPQKAGLKRCGKSCRLRWLNYLRPDIKHGGFSEEEDEIICSLFRTLGSRWSVIASHLQGRTDNDVKNHWNTKLKKKLMAATANTVKPQGANNNPGTSSSPGAHNDPEIFQYNWTRTPTASYALLPTLETGNFDYGWDFDKKPFSCSNAFTQPAPTEVRDMSSTLTNYRVLSSSQEASGSTAPLTTDTNTLKCQGIGGSDFYSMMKDFGYGSPYGLGAYVYPQENLGESPPRPSYLSYHSSSASNGSGCYGFQPSIMY